MKSMQKDKFLIAFLPFVMIFSFSLFSCFGKVERAEKKEVRFSWWGKEDRAEYTLDGISHFESLNPSIKVNPEYSSWIDYEKNFGERLLSGKCADVMLINFDWLYKYSPDGNGFYDMQELSDYLELYNFTLDDLSYGTMNGKLNAIPIAFNTAIPVFDMTELKRDNLSLPSTWDELFSMAKVLKQKGMHVFTISKRHLFFLALSWFEQNYSKKVFSEDGTLKVNTEEIGVIFDFVKRLVDENVIYSINEGFNLQALREKKVAGAVLWCNETSIFISEVEKLGGKAVLGNFISTPGAKESGWYLKPASMYAIKKDCENPKEAALLVNYLLNNHDFALLQKNDKGVPISNRSLTALMESKRLESMQYTALMKIRFNSGSINKMLPIMDDNDLILGFSDNAFAYINGDKSKEEASKAFLETINLLAK
ncbi:MAG: carbohydrate ABC transporter substrate-binding protein [Treponema sp.]|nr:carbohydrate ABC transporter substrate-binding protein [Treponema sp.]